MAAMERRKAADTVERADRAEHPDRVEQVAGTAAPVQRAVGTEPAERAAVPEQAVQAVGAETVDPLHIHSRIEKIGPSDNSDSPIIPQVQ